MSGYRRGEEPEEEIGVVLVADREVTGVAEHPLRPEHVGHLGQLLGPEYLPVAQVRREQQRLRGRMGRRGLGIPQRVRAPQVQRRGLGRQARGPPPHATPGGATHEYTERGAHGATGRTAGRPRPYHRPVRPEVTAAAKLRWGRPARVLSAGNSTPSPILQTGKRIIL